MHLEDREQCVVRQAHAEAEGLQQAEADARHLPQVLLHHSLELLLRMGREKVPGADAVSVR